MIRTNMATNMQLRLFGEYFCLAKAQAMWNELIDTLKCAMIMWIDQINYAGSSNKSRSFWRPKLGELHNFSFLRAARH